MTQKNTNARYPIKRLPNGLRVAALCALYALPLQPWAQPIPSVPGIQGTPTPAAPAQQGGSRGGFGFSIDLGSVIKAVQALTVEDRYRSPDTASLNQFEPRQVIVSWENAQQNQAAAAVQAAGGTLLSNTALPNLGLNIVLLSFTSDALAAQALVGLQATPGIAADRHAIAYPMQQAATPTPAKQYAHELLKAPAKGSSKLSGSILVGIVDTEVTNANALALTSFKAKRIFPDSDKPAPADHGNAVASIVAASGNGFEGLAQGVSLRAAGVMREVAPGINATNTLMVAQALDWMIEEKVQVVNLSLGSASDAVLSAVTTKTLSAGLVLVAAAGNGGPAAAPAYPAAYPGVIAVTAVDAQKRLYARANRGTYIAIAAPGVDVWVPMNTSAAANDSKGKYMSGTSFASPFVAAAVAQAVASQPKATAQSVLQAMCSKAANIGATAPEVGCGLLQL
jgi:subtilisin family serine protease